MNQDSRIVDDYLEGHWTDHALCKGMTEVFFGPAAESPKRRAQRLEIAASYCSRCPASVMCREEGRRRNEHGLWGGEDEVERSAAGFVPRTPSRRSVIEARDAHRRQQAEDETAGVVEITDVGRQLHRVH